MARFNKIALALNVFFALLLVLAYVSIHVPATTIPYLAPLGLGTPIWLTVNLLFAVYWLIARKKRFLLSLIPVVFSYFTLGGFFKIKLSEYEINEEDLTVLSYNAQGFNKYGRIYGEGNVGDSIISFTKRKSPDIICFQEFSHRYHELLDQYPYSYVSNSKIDGFKKSVLGVFSKYPIIAEGNLKFPNSFNMGVYADITYKNDTIRVYSLHMESMGVTPNKETIIDEPYLRLYGRLRGAFRKQQEQAEIFNGLQENNSYKTIVCGDFNNTQFSNPYRLIKGDMQDTFNEKGKGLGSTYSFLGFPFRIDFILADPAFEVRAHKNYNLPFSDHFPIMASFRLKEQ
ncbi:endonuclease/exonuclease/phosphatase family protein [Pelagihabitans pacificus]|uniref:endonuclease/exonuclease/phosphatase family protein n=1 Tax=Pelagihabitans pacificus TaxID=2696054 RepID=UPI001EE7B2B4|nr:endonuclease/exonuclease/phosphatase family protein [Pelagihabitans pacificus]